MFVAPSSRIHNALAEARLAKNCAAPEELRPEHDDVRVQRLEIEGGILERFSLGQTRSGGAQC
jgi:hypothetical protein